MRHSKDKYQNMSGFVHEIMDNFFQNISDVQIDPFFKNTPGVNVIETPTHYKLEVAAPGLNKEDFQIKVKGQKLIIAVNKPNNKREGETVRRAEFNYSNFKRMFPLPGKADVDTIKASYTNGLLIVSIGKKGAKDEKGKTINVD